VQVEIWSDVVCPWCYIGKRRFEQALERFDHATEVQVTWRSFELNPQAAFRPGRPMAEQLAAKYGGTVDDARRRLHEMDELAASVGLDFDLAATTGGNTFDAHRLLHLARRHGLGAAAKEALLHAYFVERLPIADPEVLAPAVEACGVPRDEIDEVLGSDRYAEEVRAEEAEAAELGATGVPF